MKKSRMLVKVLSYTSITWATGEMSRLVLARTGMTAFGRLIQILSSSAAILPKWHSWRLVQNWYWFSEDQSLQNGTTWCCSLRKSYYGVSVASVFYLILWLKFILISLQGRIYQYFWFQRNIQVQENIKRNAHRTRCFILIYPTTNGEASECATRNGSQLHKFSFAHAKHYDPLVLTDERTSLTKKKKAYLGVSKN